MNLTPSFLHKLRQVFFITLIWIVAGVLVELNNSIIYDPATREHYFHFIFGSNAFEHLVITAIGPLLGGILAGSFIVFYQREKLKGKTYGQKLLIHSLLYISFVVVCTLIVGVIGAMNNKADASFFQKLKEDVLSLRVLRLLITWYFIVILTIFFLDVSERYGSGTFRRLLMGKYHTPGKEERIFMFLDLKGSTTIAEQIGDERYFSMLRFFYEVANEAIINTHGEIYQYVGDEIVISWTKEDGITDANCLKCFTVIENAVQERAELFKINYGVVPSFKAGVHIGSVATGEIGTVKKDIVYSGDVLNTTARIVALCNHYQQKLIISGTLYNLLQERKDYRFVFIESTVLKGKKTIMELYGVSNV